MRHADPLQQAQTITEGNVTAIRLHPQTARDLNISDGETVRVKQAHQHHVNQTELMVKLDERIPLQAAWVAGGIAETATLGDLFGEMMIEKMTSSA